MRYPLLYSVSLVDLIETPRNFFKLPTHSSAVEKQKYCIPFKGNGYGGWLLYLSQGNKSQDQRHLLRCKQPTGGDNHEDMTLQEDGENHDVASLKDFNEMPEEQLSVLHHVIWIQCRPPLSRACSLPTTYHTEHRE